VSEGGKSSTKPALLVIDMQNEFFNRDQACNDSLKSAIENINAAVSLLLYSRVRIVVISSQIIKPLNYVVGKRII
jgi:nicotinamidase-related amidase